MQNERSAKTMIETLRLSTDSKDIEQAGEIIRNGGLVAFPTETVYGLGANAFDEDAVRSVYAAKGRPSDNPMIVHIAEAEDLELLVAGGIVSLGEDVFRLIEAIWPGPLTMVFPKSAMVPDTTTGGLDTVAVRMPSNGTAYSLIKASRRPIAAPSANISGRPSPTNAEDVLEDMDGRIDAVIMGEQCDVGIESTVLDMTGDVPVILRPGIISREYLSDVLGKEVVYDSSLLTEPGEIADPAGGAVDTSFRPRSPGMKYKHYSPKADVVLIEGSDERFGKRARELGLEAMRQGRRAAIIDYGDDPNKAAHRFFSDLRELDRQGYDLILVRALDRKGRGFGVMNRMLKSAGYEVI